jgi:hypothetical protein
MSNKNDTHFYLLKKTSARPPITVNGNSVDDSNSYPATIDVKYELLSVSKRNESITLLQIQSSISFIWHETKLNR